MESLLHHQKHGKAPEKSSFAQTCNLLSQYLKERGKLGDMISLGINGKLEVKGTETSKSPAPTTLNLLPSMESLDLETLRQKAVTSSNTKSMGFFPQIVGFGSSDPVEDTKMNSDLRKSSITDPGTAPMTLFYGGKVIVFNEFPADKAKEIMAMAGKGSCNSSNGFPSTSTDNINVANTVAADSNNGQEGVQVPPIKANGSDVPMARRASLHRFFEKRKERAAARAPYQIKELSPAPRSCEHEISNVHSHLELKL